jgi:hypothetical protein
MSYTLTGATLYRQVAIRCVAPILKGAKPADLPIARPTNFSLAIHLKTAKALGLKFLHCYSSRPIDGSSSGLVEGPTEQGSRPRETCGNGLTRQADAGRSGGVPSGDRHQAGKQSAGLCAATSSPDGAR